MAHCKCKTNKGTRCKHPSNPNSTRGYCSQHDKPANMSRSKSRSRKSKSRSKKSKSKSRSKKSSKKYRFVASFPDKLMSKLEEIKQVAVEKSNAIRRGVILDQTYDRLFKWFSTFWQLLRTKNYEIISFHNFIIS